MIAFVLAVALLLSCCLPASARAQKDEPFSFYVSPEGRDSWSGKLPAPNVAKSDGPFATVQRAHQAVRALGEPRQAARVAVRGGFYPLTETLSFDQSDSGPSPETPILYSAYPGEAPILSGGTRITGWRQTARGRWEVTLPEVAQGKWRFSQLYVNGERRLRPRLPKQGYFTIGGNYPLTPDAVGKGYNRFRYRAGDIDPNWQNRDAIEILCLHIWSCLLYTSS